MEGSLIRAKMVDILLLAAMRDEVKSIHRMLKVRQKDGSGKIPSARFRSNVLKGNLNGKSIALGITGIGPSKAKVSGKEMIDNFTPSLIINAGFAGALQEGLNIGDLILAESFFWNDGKNIGVNPVVDPAMLSTAFSVARSISIPCHKGKVMTSSTVIATRAAKSEAGKSTGSVAVEMEGAPLARLAAERNIPFISARTILDPCDSDIPDLSNIAGYKGLELVFKLGIELTSNPLLILRLGRLRKWAIIAERSLAKFLDVFIGEVPSAGGAFR